MKPVIEALENTYGDLRILGYYVACLAVLLVFFKGKRKQVVIPAIVITLAVANPFFFTIWEKLNEENVYWRALWMVPILPICAVIIALLVEKARSSAVKVTAITVGSAAIILAGSFVYVNAYPPQSFFKANSPEKLPEQSVIVGKLLCEMDEEPYVVADSELSVYLRQYSGRIHTPYSRSVVYGTPGQLGASIYSALTSGKYTELALLMANYDYEYLVTNNWVEGKAEKLEEVGFQLLDQVNNFGIYRNHYPRTEKRTYNELHQVTSLTYVNEEGEPINESDGYATIYYEYDENGRVAYEFRIDVEGNGVSDTLGRAGYRREYNYLGQITSEVLLDSSGDPVISPYAKRTCEYDGNHRLIKECYFDDKNQPMLRTDSGYASIEYIRDTFGNVTEQRMYDTEGKLTLRTDGYSIIKQTFNDDKQVLSTSYFDENNQLMLRSDLGYASIVYKRDIFGNVLEERTYNTENVLSPRKEGYSIVRREFDGDQRIISEAYFDEKDNPLDISVGYQKMVNEYAWDGSLSLSWFYNKDGKRIECGSSYFHEYLQSIIPNRQDQVVFLAIKDEGTEALTSTLLNDFKELGIKTNLKGKYRSSYYAVITPERVEENINGIQEITLEDVIGNIRFSIISAGYLTGNRCSIQINGVEYSKNLRGINIVIYSLKEKKVVQSISFDTYAREMRVTR